MSLIDRFLNAIKLNDDFDDDDDFLDDDEEEEDDRGKKSGTGRRFFSRFDADDDDDDDDDEFDDYDQPVSGSRRTSGSTASGRASGRSGSSDNSRNSSRRSERGPQERTAANPRTVSYSSKTASAERETRNRDQERNRGKKNTSAKKKSGVLPMEVNVIRPSSMEDASEIADTLMARCTVVLNLEGLDIEVAQRVVDFTCGVCYSLHGSLQKISSYIFILTPEGVDISGDFQSILDGTFDLSSMNRRY